MIISGEKPQGDTIENTWDTLTPTEGPAGETIEITSEEQLNSRIMANAAEYDNTVRTLIYLAKRQIEGKASDAELDLSSTAESLQDMLLRGTFETSDTNAQLAANGTILHHKDFDAYWTDSKVLAEGLPKDASGEIQQITLTNGKEDSEQIRQFCEDICEKVTSENIRAARVRETSYLLTMQEMLSKALAHNSLEGASYVKESYYDAIAKVQDHFAEMQRLRDEEKSRSYGNTSIQIAGKTEEIGHEA